jgi:hypothetical protein
MPRREGEVFFFGTAMAPGLFHSSVTVDFDKGGADSTLFMLAQAWGLVQPLGPRSAASLAKGVRGASSGTSSKPAGKCAPAARG